MFIKSYEKQTMLETILSMYNFVHLQSIDIDWNTWNVHMASIMTLDAKYVKKNFQGSFNTCRVATNWIKHYFLYKRTCSMTLCINRSTYVTPSDSRTIFNIKFESHNLNFLVSKKWFWLSTTHNTVGYATKLSYFWNYWQTTISSNTLGQTK